MLFKHTTQKNGNVNQKAVVFSGRLRPKIIDVKLPAQWLRECQDNHAESSAYKESSWIVDQRHRANLLNSEIPIFRLFDVRESKIVEFRDVNIAYFEYAALSYMWGGPQKTVLLKDNRKALQESGSLNGCISKTVQNAIGFSQQLGIQHLWVDALCIIQSDDSDKAIQIGKMGSIYAHAKVTLIAASGRNSEAGLPGFRTPRTGKQTQILISRVDTQFSMKLMRTLNPHNNGFSFSHQLDDAEWSRRGWTLQERALSRRSIIFTDQQLIWACKQCHRTEETYCETSLAHTSWFRLQETEYFLDTSLRSFFASDDVIEQTWYRFRLLVLDFTKRQLTNPGDAHDAIHAILEQVKHLTGDTFLWGLPTTNFEMGLCWEPSSPLGVRKRKDLTVLKTTSLNRRVPFPSWSWLGWHNAISIRVEERYRDLGMDPEIICYVLRNSPLRLVRVLRISSDVPGEQTRFHPLQSQQSSPNAISLEDIPKHYPDLGVDKLDDTPDDQLIFFWAEVAQFEVSEIMTMAFESSKNTPWEPRYTYKQRDIRDTNGNVVAQTAYCDFEENARENGTSCIEEPEAGGGTYDFVLIANNNPPDPESKPSKLYCRSRERMESCIGSTMQRYQRKLGKDRKQEECWWLLVDRIIILNLKIFGGALANAIWFKYFKRFYERFPISPLKYSLDKEHETYRMHAVALRALRTHRHPLSRQTCRIIAGCRFPPPRRNFHRSAISYSTPDDPATPENDKEARAGIEDIPRIPEDGEQENTTDVPQNPTEAELENPVAEDSIQPVENIDPEQRSRGRLSGRTLRANRQKQPEGLPPIILPDWFWNNVKLVEELPQTGSLAVYYGGNVPEFVESSPGPEATEKMSHAIKSIVECDLPPTEKARYSMHVDVYKEILASIRAGLKLRPSQAVLDGKNIMRPILHLLCPKDGGTLYLDSVVETISTKLGADLIRLDPVDIAQILGPYIDENLAWTGSKASLLGYETSRMAGRLEDYEKDSSTLPEDIEGVEEEEMTGMSKKAGPAIAFTASNSSEAQKKLSAIFSRLKGALTPAAENNRRSSDVVMPFATFADPNFSASSNGNSSFGNVKSNAEQWNDLKTTALLESFVAAADSKRASESSGADATNTKDLIIQVRDYKDLTRTYDGYNIIDKLRTVVTKRWQSGRNIIMVGTSSLEQGESELSSAGIQHLQSDIVEGEKRTIFVPPDRRAEQDTIFESDDKLRIRTLNIRHVEDMITKLSGDTPVTVDIEKDLDVAWVVSAGLDDAVWHYARVQRLATTILGLENSPEIIDGPTFWKAQQLLSESDNAKFSWGAAELKEEDNDVNKMLDEINASPKKTDIREKLKQIRKTCTPHEKKLLGGVVIPSDIHTKFEDVHAPKETVEALKTLTSLSLIRPEAFTYGVLATDKMPGLLLYGPPGTGKTLLAKAVAKESGATVLEISGAEVNDMYVGEGEKNVRAIFSLAKKLSPCVVFIDEADAIFAARGDTKRSTAHREMINQFLREWDGMNDLSAFIMVATNRPFDLDEAVLRRLPRRLLVDLPVEKDRESILKIHLKDEIIDSSVSLAELAKNTPFYSGSDLKNLSVAAALACIREENELATKHEGDTPYTYPEKRILTKQHFDKAMEEISASISEDMSTLSAIRKFDEKYGDRKGRRKKSAGLGFGGTTVPEKDSEAGRVRKSPLAV
ncbi:putative mitochondrial aaa atpase protein [Botrytis fragariae]|uniref:Putative mitochondrial aaa atpase protein n=1 Tax=Botrytis fragariae TaxID=1964551 RepID=A0A8H6ASB6_9HELO|nr:putative mitochondrial aaa atpase protein [Botrytis fragariae]KAF5872891.1 putative mitochondrial aaa atpase protein [Botrytis fragariae]